MSVLTLRGYQTAAIEAVYDYLRNQDGNPCVVAPTGCGKGVMLAQIVHDAILRWKGRVLLLTHVRELIAQNAKQIRRLCPDLPIGIYSAGLKRRDLSQPVICAGIQSIYQRACEFDPFDLILIDEAHLISGRDDSMYGQFLADSKIINPHVRLVGFTATPFRLDSGLIYGPDQLFQDTCYEIGIRELIRDSYLCPLISKAGNTKIDTSNLHVRGGEFIAAEVEDLMDGEELVAAACREIVALTEDRHSVLIFAAGLRHARHVQQVLKEEHQQECGFISGITPIPEREEVLSRFRGDRSDGLFDRPPLKYLVNVSVLTTGFDAPGVDAIAILRPTMSPGLLVQIVGRGFRLHSDKRNCLILDYGGNIARHGPIDQIQVNVNKSGSPGEAPAKECPECQSVIAAGYATCPDCGYEFPPPERNKHEAKASEEGVLSGEVTDEEYEVLDIQYFVHTKRDAKPEDPQTMRVEYRLGLDHWVNEWVCLEHTGYARRRAEKWWRERSPDPIPDTADRAVDIANAGGVAYAEKITVRTISGDPFPRIIRHELGAKPEARTFSIFDLEEVPF